MKHDPGFYGHTKVIVLHSLDPEIGRDRHVFLPKNWGNIEELHTLLDNLTAPLSEWGWEQIDAQLTTAGYSVPSWWKTDARYWAEAPILLSRGNIRE